MSQSLQSQNGISPAPRRGWLRHGNRPGDYAKAPRCGARTRSGGCCRQPAMANGRCRMHGGLSTGPRTAEGLARARRARWKHGYASAEIRAFRREAAHAARKLAALIRLDRDLRRLKRAATAGRSSGKVEPSNSRLAWGGSNGFDYLPARPLDQSCPISAPRQAAAESAMPAANLHPAGSARRIPDMPL